MATSGIFWYFPKAGILCVSVRRQFPEGSPAARSLRREVNSELNFSPNFEGLVLGCIDADFCK